MNYIDGSPASESVTLVEVLKIMRPFEEFEAVIQAAVRRLEAEGVKSLVGMQFSAQVQLKWAQSLLLPTATNSWSISI